ncbi:MAG: SRPBCC family protein [Jatrophihabitans sp.]|nr:MAG: SRPBCC family protein [Jatrophihabitans sp.]
MTWYDLEPVDETFFDTATHVHSYPVDLPVPPERLWESLTSDRALADWGLGLSRLEWTSPRPFGIGTTREVVLPLRAMAVRERFFRWEEGRRTSFYGVATNRPLLRGFAEDYRVEPAPGGCRFTWTIAVQPRPRTRLLLRAADPVNALLYRSVPVRAKAYFAKHP